ncbi:MAG: hypothetical protein V7690_01470 [Shewanella sp.]|uniref:hypothetical protein n=1 Tax=Shewanella sp. TaxID=50422 RepID=UPI00300197E6
MTFRIISSLMPVPNSIIKQLNQLAVKYKGQRVVVSPHCNLVCNLYLRGHFRDFEFFDAVDNNTSKQGKNLSCIDGFYHYFCNNQTAMKMKTPWQQGIATSISPDYIYDIQQLTPVKHVHYGAVQSLLDIIETEKVTNLIVYGSGVFFAYLYDFLIEKNIKIVTVIDKIAEIEPFKFNSIPIVPLSNYNVSQSDSILIASSAFFSEIKSDLSKVINLADYNIISI